MTPKRRIERLEANLPVKQSNITVVFWSETDGYYSQLPNGEIAATYNSESEAIAQFPDTDTVFFVYFGDPELATSV